MVSGGAPSFATLLTPSRIWAPESDVMVCSLARSLVEVDEEARRGKHLRRLLLHQIELDRRGDGVPGAGAELSLIVDLLRGLGAQIHVRGQLLQVGDGRRVELIPVIRDVGDPTETVRGGHVFLRASG
jgi:hypothetical protein